MSSPRRTLSRQDRAFLAAFADASERAVERWWRGAPGKLRLDERIAHAARQLGIERPPPLVADAETRGDIAPPADDAEPSR